MTAEPLALRVPASPVRAFVGVGSNLNHPLQQVRRAFDALGRLPGTSLVARSALYRSAPMGPADQPHYINAVACLETAASPLALLGELQAIERRHGRVRGNERWGPRTLDLDLLLYASLEINDAQLRVPHPGLHERAFVLYPLHDIAPEIEIPGRGTLAEVLRSVPEDDLCRVAAR